MVAQRVPIIIEVIKVFKLFLNCRSSYSVYLSTQRTHEMHWKCQLKSQLTKLYQFTRMKGVKI